MKSSDEMFSVKEILKSKEFKAESDNQYNFLIHKVLRDAERNGRKPSRQVKKAEKKLA